MNIYIAIKSIKRRNLHGHSCRNTEIKRKLEIHMYKVGKNVFLLSIMRSTNIKTK
jgi:hypothetical protein